MRVIVVEDDVRLRSSLVERLRLDGFGVDGAGSALEFYREMATAPYDIAIIDVGLPDGNGLEIAAWLRKKAATGIVLLTARGEVRDRIDGFRSGADLYFVKPFDSDELVQAIRGLARRVVRSEARQAELDPPPARWYLDTVAWTLRSPRGDGVKLTAAEMKFVQRLLVQSGVAISRHALRAELGYSDDTTGNQSLDALVKRLRRKIEPVADGSTPIQTVHGHGYLFSAPVRVDRRIRTGG